MKLGTNPYNVGATRSVVTLQNEANVNFVRKRKLATPARQFLSADGRGALFLVLASIKHSNISYS